MSGDLPLFDSGRGDLLGIESYAKFRRALAESGCARCGLSAGRASIVVDRGNPAAKVLLVGEGPGADEDATGRAFVGRGGKLLDGLFAEIGIDTDRDVLIANVVKCRPPENRAPKAGEAAACRPFLDHQIRLVRPEVIAPMGATAVRFLFPEKKGEPMRDLVGRPFTSPAFPGVRAIPLYHPAYLLRDPRKLPQAREHLKTLADWLRADAAGERPEG